MVVKLGAVSVSDVSAALLNYKVQDRIVGLWFFSCIPIVLASHSCIPRAESAFWIGKLRVRLSIDLWLAFLGWLAS